MPTSEFSKGLILGAGLFKALVEVHGFHPAAALGTVTLHGSIIESMRDRSWAEIAEALADRQPKSEVKPLELLKGYTKFNPHAGVPGGQVHSCGAPGGFVARLTTERKAVDGYTAIYVYKDRVALMSIRFPYLHERWITLDSAPYNTVSELKALLDDFTKAPVASCW
jgi:hypothetical protein